MILFWVVGKLAPLFALLALGFLVGRQLGVGEKTLHDLGGLLIYLLVPAKILLATQQTEFAVTWEPVLAAVVVVGASTAVAWWLARWLALPAAAGSALMLGSGFMNAGSLGTSVADQFYGEQGFLLAMLFYITVQALLYTVGPALVGGGREQLREGAVNALRLPLIWALLLGLALNRAGTELPAAAGTSLEILSGAWKPVLLLTLGMQLSHTSQLETAGLRRLLPPLVVARMATGLAAAAALVLTLGLHGDLAAVVLISSSMPSAITTYVVGAHCGSNTRRLSLGILGTTLLALVTIPLVVLLAEAWV
jgi:predicted permease